eukprot:GFUD01004308.1.p1 GENE.GFUD01004308.1~~GFUD01004308.1.p1  ORF type:complete len:497 (+),score=137.88 GFUD01004308.1:413-1903(+)
MMDSSNFVPRRRSVISQVISYFTSSGSSTEQEESIGENKGKDSEIMSYNNSESAYLNSKAHTLHSAHKMNDQQKKWFENIKEVPPFQFAHSPPEDLPAYLKQKQFKPSEPDIQSSQYAFNINRNCYENLPVNQTSYNPSAPHCEDFYPDEFQYFQEEETLALAPSFPPLGNLYDNIMDFVETTIVQYVCQRTHPSPFRLAAETLAASRLNPNAKEFTPMDKNKAVIEKEEEGEEKNWSSTLLQTSQVEEEKSIEEEESSNIIGVHLMTEEEENVGERLMPTKDRTLTSFMEENSMEEVQSYASENSICDSKIQPGKDDFFSLNEDDSDDEDDYDDDDSDSDWDSDEQSTGQCVEIDPSEFEDLFPSALMMTNLRVCNSTSSNKELLICQIFPSPSSSSDISMLSPANRTISEINIQFFDQDQIIPGCCRKSEKSVQFCDDVTVIEEPDDLADDLQNARISDFPARQADRERMERLLAPILTEVHRGKMYQKIYGCS